MCPNFAQKLSKVSQTIFLRAEKLVFKFSYLSKIWIQTYTIFVYFLVT